MWMEHCTIWMGELLPSRVLRAAVPRGWRAISANPKKKKKKKKKKNSLSLIKIKKTTKKEKKKNAND
eukprot:NODE_20623_length_790_cov_1.123680.p3 GENE.NODE_20623_length_790_cov_1.123680~~NODE_20623_length_790_cov_1.123680.p3  ORF type:complete len:67 (-),score=32.84 NODE_20623_length_790_cov_1.123680:76-276(-)